MTKLEDQIAAKFAELQELTRGLSLTVTVLHRWQVQDAKGLDVFHSHDAEAIRRFIAENREAYLT